jgi:predicted DNA-binding transcriptional regulator YafY
VEKIVDSPTTRVLTVLELLQSHVRMTGREIAHCLDVDIRTVRRYILMLEDLGIPVVAERGRYGAYRLLPGYKLPPLMFTEEEALALTLGLLAARGLGLSAATPGLEGAISKVERVMPARLRERVRAVEETLVLDLRPGGAGPSGAVVMSLSAAAQGRQRVWMRYRAMDGEETERLFDPYGLVYRHGRWYVTGYCHLRGDLRLFRLERVVTAEVREENFVRPSGFDALDWVLRSLGSVPRNWPVEALLETTLEEARRTISAGVATLETADGGVLLRCSTDDLTWLARLLASLGCPLVVRRPPELREALRRHAKEILLSAGRRESRSRTIQAENRG